LQQQLDAAIQKIQKSQPRSPAPLRRIKRLLPEVEY
jgi:hypothetical protein